MSARQIVGGGSGYSCQDIIIHTDITIDKHDETIDKIVAACADVLTSL
jgi:hypothetical protein